MIEYQDGNKVLKGNKRYEKQGASKQEISHRINTIKYYYLVLRIKNLV